MHDSIKKIRLDLLNCGLKWLLSKGSDVSASRKDLFIGLMNLKDVNEAKKVKILKEAHNKQWQVICLDRLIDAGFMRKHGQASQTTYSITDSDSISLLLKDYDNDGVMLAHYLFPKEVPAPSLSKMVFGSDPNPDETSDELDQSVKLSEEIIAEPQEELDVGKLLVAVAAGVADVKDKQTDLLKRMLNVFQSLLEPFTKLIIEHHTHLLNFVEEKHSDLSTKFDAKINSSNKRINDLESAIKAQLNVLEANQAAVKKLNLSEDFLKKIIEADKNTQQLQASVNELTVLVRAKEQNKLSDILAAVKRNSEESSQLQQLILDAVAESK